MGTHASQIQVLGGIAVVTVPWYWQKANSRSDDLKLYLGGGFKYVLFGTPTWGNDPTWLNLTNIFEMGRNHQLDIYTQKS